MIGINERIFAIWAPEESPWSLWAKPVLFAHLHLAEDIPRQVVADIHWCPEADGKTALVINVRGASGVWMGAALAGRAYRPVPLYNAVPLSGWPVLNQPVARQAIGAVNVLPIVAALKASAEILSRAAVGPKAPPAFLLDFNRHGTGRKPEIGGFDNRSVAVTTDFPSANFLAAQGIERVILVQEHDLEPQSDLAHTLRRWQDGGIRLERLRLEPLDGPDCFEVGRPSWFGAMFQRALCQLGLRRGDNGGFGNWISDTASGG